LRTQTWRTNQRCEEDRTDGQPNRCGVRRNVRHFPLLCDCSPIR